MNLKTRASRLSEEMFLKVKDKFEINFDYFKCHNEKNNTSIYVIKTIGDTYNYQITCTVKNNELLGITSWGSLIDNQGCKHIYPVWQYTLPEYRGIGIQSNALDLILSDFKLAQYPYSLMSCYDVDNDFWRNILIKNGARGMGYKNYAGQEVLDTGSFSKKIKSDLKSKFKDIDY